ncbi:MAG: SsgA family sporulation/cell division regulator [Marmoricola sp.]|jgi:sporulation and cell division protein SsgA
MEKHPATSGAAAGKTSETTDVLRAAVPFLSGESATEHLDGEFAYDPADPYAVTMKLEARCGSVTWTFARDLLAEGVYAPTGDGDVQVWPCLSTTGEAVVIVELCSPDGTALLQTDSRAVQRFVTSTYDAVPAGGESSHVSIDDLVTRLLEP